MMHVAQTYCKLLHSLKLRAKDQWQENLLHPNLKMNHLPTKKWFAGVNSLFVSGRVQVYHKYIYIYLRVCKNAFLLCAFAFIFPLQAPSLLYPLSLRSTAVCRLQEISEEPKIWVPFKIKQSIYTLLLLRIMKYTYSKDCITLINTYDINWYKYKMISKEQTVDKSPQPSTAQQPPCFSKVIPTNKHSKTHTHRKPQKKQKN